MGERQPDGGPNSAPGFSGFEAATGANVARQILQHCHWRIRRQLSAPLLPALVERVTQVQRTP